MSAIEIMKGMQLTQVLSVVVTSNEVSSSRPLRRSVAPLWNRNITCVLLNISHNAKQEIIKVALSILHSKIVTEVVLKF